MQSSFACMESLRRMRSWTGVLVRHLGQACSSQLKAGLATEVLTQLTLHIKAPRLPWLGSTPAELSRDMFLPFLPEDNASIDEQTDEVLHIINDDLAGLLRLHPAAFWRDIRADQSIHACLASYLQYARRAVTLQRECTCITFTCGSRAEPWHAHECTSCGPLAQMVHHWSVQARL